MKIAAKDTTRLIGSLRLKKLGRASANFLLLLSLEY